MTVLTNWRKLSTNQNTGVMSRVTHPCTNTLMYSYSCSNNTHTGLFGEMDGDLTKEGVWGYYSLAANGKWLQEECRVVKELCSKLQDSGYGTTGQVYFHL